MGTHANILAAYQGRQLKFFCEDSLSTLIARPLSGTPTLHSTELRLYGAKASPPPLILLILHIAGYHGRELLHELFRMELSYKAIKYWPGNNPVII